MATSYKTDFAAWAAEQAGLLRAGLVNSIDFRNLAEEIEDMGRSEQRALESRLQVLICHLLKWKFQPDRRGSSWKAMIQEQRRGIKKLLKESPSLKSRLDDVEFAHDAWLDGVAAALRETELENTFPDDAVWSMADILNDGFLPD